MVASVASGNDTTRAAEGPAERGDAESRSAELGASHSAGRPDGWFRTTSPEEARHLCESAFYPHRLTLLGSSNGFALSQRAATVGPITLGDVTYETDVRLGFEEDRASYHVDVPLIGGLESFYRGREVTATPEVASVYRPEGEVTVTRWPAGSRHLAVSIDRLAVDGALESLTGRPVHAPIAFEPALLLDSRAARSWVQLLMTVHQQSGFPDGLTRHPLVCEPLVESLIHGLLLLVDHPCREALAAPVPAVRPAAVRDAMHLIETMPDLPLTTAMLAKQCHVSVRTLQEGFQRHLGTSPMTYVREVRLRRAHSDLRSADPSRSTVASIAHRWGFTHLGRFAAVYKARYGETPMRALRAAR
jgi:AraC-like DNA-binding protein